MYLGRANCPNKRVMLHNKYISTWNYLFRSVWVSVFLVMCWQQHRLFLDLPFPPSLPPSLSHLSLPPWSLLGQHILGGDEEGIKEGGSRATSLCWRLFILPFSLLLSLFMWLPCFFLFTFFLLPLLHSQISILVNLCTVLQVSTFLCFLPSCVCHIPCGFEKDERERQREREREGWPCRRGDVSSCCHWVLLQLICSLFLSFLLITFSPVSVHNRATHSFLK